MSNRCRRTVGRVGLAEISRRGYSTKGRLRHRPTAGRRLAKSRPISSRLQIHDESCQEVHRRSPRTVSQLDRPEGDHVANEDQHASDTSCTIPQIWLGVIHMQNLGNDQKPEEEQDRVQEGQCKQVGKGPADDRLGADTCGWSRRGRGIGSPMRRIRTPSRRRRGPRRTSRRHWIRA